MREVTLRLNVSAVGEAVESTVDFLEVTLDEDDLRQIRRRQRIVRGEEAYGLSSFDWGPAWFKGDNPDEVAPEDAESAEREPRAVDCPMRVVCSDRILFEAYIKHTNIRIESESFKIKDLEDMFGERPAGDAPSGLVMEYHYADGDCGAYEGGPDLREIWEGFSPLGHASHILIRPDTEEGQQTSDNLLRARAAVGFVRQVAEIPRLGEKVGDTDPRMLEVPDFLVEEARRGAFWKGRAQRARRDCRSTRGGGMIPVNTKPGTVCRFRDHGQYDKAFDVEIIEAYQCEFRGTVVRTSPALEKTHAIGRTDDWDSAMFDVVYPEHEKLTAVQEVSQKIHEFVLEFMQEKGIRLCELIPEQGQYYPVILPVQDLVAEFLGVDQRKLEEEERAMLEAVRNQQEEARPCI
jgi:hypothetical protein